MVLTITFNPAIDKVYHCPGLTAAGVYRAEKSETYAAGKGINVTRGLKDLGEPALALGFAGAQLGNLLRELLHCERIQEDLTPTASEVRLNPTIRDPSTEEDLHVIEPAGPISPEERERFLFTFLGHLPKASAVVFAGSCPPHIESGFVREILRKAHTAGVPTFADSRGGYLEAALEACPRLIKPNLLELEQVAGRKISSEEDALIAAQQIVGRGVGTVLVSRGRKGALWISQKETFRAIPPALCAVNTVGCGDAMLAAVVSATLQDLCPEDTVRYGVAAGSANALVDAPGAIPKSHFDEILPRVSINAI